MSRNFISKRYIGAAATAMGKSDVLAGSYDDVIDLSLGDPDLITDRRIIDAAFADAIKGHTRYTEFRGDPELRGEIRRFYKEEYDMNVSDEEVFVTASGCIAMYLALEATLDDDDEVILCAPYFTPYPDQVRLARGVPVELPTYEEEDFQINFDRLESLISPKTKAIIINSPCNPTGMTFSEDTLMRLAAAVKAHDLLVIADDIYTAFSFSEKFVPFASLPGMRERTITINSFSKNFTMTGWRVGNIIAPPDVVRTVQRINENVVFTAPSISQRAAIYALRMRDEIQPPLVEEYRKRAYYAAERINKVKGLSVLYPPKGTFYLFPNVKATGLSSEEAADKILKEAHVLTLPGNAFGACGEGYLRLALTCGIDKLCEAFDRIETADPFS